MTKCSRCGDVKAISEFPIKRSAPGGRLLWCRSCERAYHRAYYLRNKVSAARKQRAYRELNRETMNAYTRKYYKSHREKVLEQSRQRYLRKHQEILERQRDYRDRNIEQCRRSSRDYIDLNREAINKRKSAKYAAVRAKASHSGLPYTKSEDSVVLRTDLSQVEIAFMLRRTIGSVSERRRRLLVTAAVGAA